MSRDRTALWPALPSPALAVVGLSLLLACSAEPARSAGAPVAASSPRGSDGAASTTAASSRTARGHEPAGHSEVPTADTAQDAEDAPSRRCSAHSLALDADRDARTTADLSDCRFAKTGHDDLGDGCGAPAHDQPVALDRLDEAVLPFDAATATHVRAIAAEGSELGRKSNVFAVIGDSISASPKFLRPFNGQQQLDEPVAERLRVAGGGTVVDFYRQARLVAGLNSFSAPRAAKVGAPSRWALPDGVSPEAGPAGQLLRQLSPSIAIVLFGSNDAAVRFAVLPELVRAYRERMARIVDLLEAEGVVPVLNTVPRHTYDPTRRDCDHAPGDLSNWRLAVQTNALSAATAELACELHLPLIDLRHGLDALLNHGIGPDGVHPNAHRGGAGLLTAQGLQCGYNVRNYVTLRMLRQLRDLLSS